ncbi:cell growth regulator with RING finger domain protein 1 isoform X1 [Etheostoma spectabile]|uniref:cell growth regulator with RING finger domain protein 1 isoform X1 n=1 Tax=Etheostoma spectabile TaxID=54343 RepID=UPI0013AEE877|nr:cell growth regulator with RING finger domain protein 1 isoform X1 [Etheostoma spectabile]
MSEPVYITSTCSVVSCVSAWYSLCIGPAFLFSHLLVTLCCTLPWFGFDVPVILRSSDETESHLLTPEKQMVQMTNPFTLKLGSGPASVTDGVSVGPCCLEPCVLSCFWGCKVSALQGALQAHQDGLKLSTPQNYLEALHLQYHYSQTFHIGNLDRVECHTQIPADHEIKDFGLLPRECYPLVAVLTLAEPEARDAYNIVASVTVIHVPDDKYSLSARVLFQYLLTSQGNMYELKPLFMSAVSRGESEPFHSEQNTQPREPNDEASRGEHTPVLEEDWSEGKGRDCVVCQNAAVNKVLLPCRHACVCDSCVSHFQHCPICRAFVQESFTLTQGPAAEQ